MSSVPTSEVSPATDEPVTVAPAITRPFVYERRRAPRRVITGHATGVVSDPHDPTRPKRICAVQLMNISATGLGAISAEPLPTGAAISLFMGPHGAEPGFDLRGTVVRCDQRAHGHEIGVAFTRRRAA